MCWSCSHTPSACPPPRYERGWSSPAAYGIGGSSPLVPATGLRRRRPTYSRRSKGAMSPAPQDETARKESAKDLGKFSKVRAETQLQRIQAQIQPKKQVRRRLHSRKPYQQRLLNMAEARREIVAALKFHRATMKQASERQQKQQEQQKQFSSLLEFPPYSLGTPGDQSSSDMNSWRNLTSLRSKITLVDASAYGYMSSTTSPHSHLSNLAWSSSSISPIEISGNLNTVLPTLPLGLNLNLQSFDDIETVVTSSSCNASPLSNFCVTTPSSSAPSSSTSSAYSFSSRALSAAEIPSVLLGTAGASEVTSEPTIDFVNHSVVETTVDEPQNIVNQYHMDWKDTVNLVQSEWCDLLETTMENGCEAREDRAIDGKREEIVHEIIDFPPWLSEQLHLDNFHTGAEYPGELTFPCLDISETEGLYGEWML